MSNQPKNIRAYFPPQAIHVIGNDDGKTDGDRIREAYGLSTKIVVNSSGNPSNMQMIFELDKSGKWTVEFKGLKEFVQALIDKKYSDSEKVADDIITKSLRPFSTAMKEAIQKILIEDFGFAPKTRTKESLSQTSSAREVGFGGKHFKDNPNWSPKEREQAVKAYFRDLAERGVYEE